MNKWTFFLFLFLLFFSYCNEWTNGATFLNCDRISILKKDIINCMYNIISKLNNFKKNILEQSKCTDCDYVLIHL